jgi:FkbM family methyltransferase
MTRDLKQIVHGAVRSQAALRRIDMPVLVKSQPTPKAARRPRYFRHGFGQEGEDLILAELFLGKRDGFYIDVGAHHPKRFSNTYHFYRFRGWRGINIEAMPGSMKAFRRARPNDINVEAAVSDSSEELTYFVFNEPALNTFDPALAAERDGKKGYYIAERMPIRTRRLEEILEKHLPAGTKIDFLTVDVEGFDLKVLHSNDWKRFRPTVVLVEDISVSNWREINDSVTTRYLRGHG